jgi:hypothetical protein
VSFIGSLAKVNGGEAVQSRLVIEDEHIDITTEYEPDPTWEYLDPAGHYHARSTGDPALPTLKALAEHVNCDDPAHGDCEGYTRTTYQCIACDAPVEPRHRRTEGRRFMRGRQSWTVEVWQHVAGAERVSVVVDTPQGKRFGFAVPVEVAAEGGADGIRVRTHLVGASPLGEWVAPGGVL